MFNIVFVVLISINPFIKSFNGLINFCLQDIFEGGGFCPVTTDGFGIGYKMNRDTLGFCVSTYHQHANGSDMIKALEESVNEIAQIVRSQKFE